MSTNYKISAVILTLNEEENLPRCLDSIEGLVDEVIIIDSYSTDGTEQICRDRGVKFIQNTFLGFIEQRTFAVNQASYDYVLALDADEEVSPALYKEIERAKLDMKADAYTFNRLSCLAGKWIRHCGWYPDRKLRLWNRKKGKPGGLNPHDRTIMEPGTSKTHLKGDLHHYAFSSVEQLIEQTKNYARVAALNASMKGRRSSILQIIIAPRIKFLECYLFHLGFLDGEYGFIISSVSAMGKYLKCIHLYNLNKSR